MPKFREDFDSEEDYLRHRFALARKMRDKYSQEQIEQEPYVAWAKRAMAREEAAMWERIRTEFPKQKGWAANLAAHNWIIKVEGDRLYAIGRSDQLVSIADAAPVKADVFPSCCKACQHYWRIEKRQGVCKKHDERVFDHDACEDYTRPT